MKLLGSITLMKEMAERMNIEEARRPDLDELTQELVPEQVLETIDVKEREFQSTKPPA